VRIEGREEIDLARERLWELITDPQFLLKCIPGLERVTSQGPADFECAVRADYAFVKGTAKVRAEIGELVRPSSATLTLTASTVGASANARSRVDLEAKDASTVVHWSAEVETRGLLAGLGQGLVEGVARDMVQKLFSNIRERALGR